MKKILAILILGYLVNPVSASNHNNGKKEKDTISLKCLLSSPTLFYGIELGEKPVRDIVDTLVNEIPTYDTAQQVKLVILSGKDLGFTNQTNISWNAILDSAKSKGYRVCPPQIGPELYVLSQNMPGTQTLLTNKTLKGRPLFIGMDKLRHMGTEETQTSKGFKLFERKPFYDFIFCIKSNTSLTDYVLGYSVTNTSTDDNSFGWTSSDMFIFISKAK